MATIPVLNLVRSKKVYKERRTTFVDDYRLLYRFDETNVEWIANHFLGESYETRGGAIANKQRMHIFLRYMADPGFQIGVGEDLGIKQSTVSKIVNNVRIKILEKAQMWIKFPVNLTDALKSKTEWTNRFTIPTVIGVIDCTHIRITKPHENGDEYINRKGYCSINVQATCNSKEYFTSVNAEWPGSVHDSRIFKNSDLYQVLQNLNQENSHVSLLGDSGYGSAPWMLVPYPNPVTEQEKNYNKVYAKERVIIERCFGQVKRRFPSLHYKLRTATNRVPGMITACFVLHNVAKYLGDPEDFEQICDDSPPTIPEYQELSDNAIRAQGKQFRNRVAEMLYCCQ